VDNPQNSSERAVLIPDYLSSIYQPIMTAVKGIILATTWFNHVMHGDSVTPIESSMIPHESLMKYQLVDIYETVY
jgi:hypothetical protein